MSRFVEIPEEYITLAELEKMREQELEETRNELEEALNSLCEQ